jgi:sterol desaturase/sphingolipid hydroxylase (fatty acid hydroxylase superfamily)
LSRAVWWHPSARADYRLYFANALVLPALFGVLLFNAKHVVHWLDALFGGSTAAASADASIVSRVAFTLVFFVAYDLGRFVAHSLLHDVPVLWEFHKVHHSAETLNPITTFRAHPVDLAVMAWVPALTTGVATWLFTKVTAVPVSFYTFLGLHVLVFAFNLIGILRHTHVWLHFGPVWGKWFISPAHHQLHHSCEAEHVGGVNRGFELALWDRLYGTLYVPGRKTPFRMGLGDGTEAEWHNVRRMYVMPFTLARERIKAGTRRLLGRPDETGTAAAPDGALSAGLPKPPPG